jgi:hypothetical protein
MPQVLTDFGFLWLNSAGTSFKAASQGIYIHVLGGPSASNFGIQWAGK